jgi:hypothetical protein
MEVAGISGPPVKVPINAAACIDLDAPTLAAERVKGEGHRALACVVPQCREWHYDGPADGHRRGTLPRFEQPVLVERVQSGARSTTLRNYPRSHCAPPGFAPSLAFSCCGPA